MDDVLSDHPADVLIEGPNLLGRGFYRYEQYRVAHPGDAARWRDVVRVGRVVVILAINLERDEIVLIREFRLGAHLATGRGDVVEVPAGRVERDESLADAARRECLEEAGVAPEKLVPLFSVMPSPGMSDEHQFFFLALVDASKVPPKAGSAREHEQTRPMHVPIDDALRMLERGELCYGAAVFALQWLALNRARLGDIVRRGGAS